MSAPRLPDSPTPSGALPAQAVNAPVFVPKSAGSPVPTPAVANTSYVSNLCPVAPCLDSFDSTPTSAAAILSPQPESSFDHYEDQDYTTSSVSIDDLSNQFQNVRSVSLTAFRPLMISCRWIRMLRTTSIRWITMVPPWTCSIPSLPLYGSL